MPQPTSTGRRAASGVLLVALLAGCQASGDGTPTAAESGAPAPIGAESGTPAPTGSASTATPTTSPSPVTAANTVEVCEAVDRLLLDASRKIAADSTAATERKLTGEQITAQLRETLADLADQVDAQARRAQDREIRTLVAGTADRIDAGARAERPTAWLAETYTDIPATLMRDCRP
ncbi:hypothetical protein [Micromonospora sp. URMC 103]|uniref:hypothetical protein n=1 Tax=Micromonospora sp. URMC 103 TaxID=3423406 RepID=UPI003F1BB0E2